MIDTEKINIIIKKIKKADSVYLKATQIWEDFPMIDKKNRDCWGELNRYLEEIDIEEYKETVEDLILITNDSYRVVNYLETRINEKIKNRNEELKIIISEESISSDEIVQYDYLVSGVLSAGRGVELKAISPSRHEIILKYNRILEEILKIKEEYTNQPTNRDHSGLLKEEKEQKDIELKEWILPDYLKQFQEIEAELFERGYIDNSYKWLNKKTVLIDFLCVISEYKFFKPSVKRKKIRDFHKRQFISERYGYKKTGLTETWKKYKPQFEHSKIPFLWIMKPE